MDISRLIGKLFDREPIEIIVVDGGPCSGKTSFMNKIRQLLLERGIIAVIVPEVATMLKPNGLHPKDFSDVDYQKAVVQLQLAHEKHFAELAVRLREKYNKRVVLICDRGSLSGGAYMKTGMLSDFQKLVLKPLGLSIETLRRTYKGVLLLQSAAVDAEEYYTTEDNEAREEGIEQARILEERTPLMWVGSEEVRKVNNRDTSGNQLLFDDKLTIACKEFMDILGEPFRVQNERKFVLSHFDAHKLPQGAISIDIEQMYLESPRGVEHRIRKYSSMGFDSYSFTQKTPVSGGGRIKTEHIISKEEYEQLQKNGNPSLAVIKKRRHCFFPGKGQGYYKIDEFDFGHISNAVKKEPLVILELYGEDPLLEGISIKKEVTHDSAYKNRNLAEAYNQ